MKSLIIILIIVGIIWLIRKILSKFKVPKVGSLALVTGGVKCGKTTFAVALAYSNYKKVLRKVKFANFFRKLFGMKLEEEPLFYSNIPLGVPYVPVTKDLILRKQRFRYRSVIYISEASLLADNTLYKYPELQDRINLFNKLIGHSTKGGLLVYDTQAVGDISIGIRRNISEYFYVNSLTKWIPYFLVCHIIENRYSEDGSVQAIDDSDLDEKLKKVIIKKSTWKLFDSYCYSVFTDDLPVADKVTTANTLKCYDIVSFRDNPLLHKTEKKEDKKNEKKND